MSDGCEIVFYNVHHFGLAIQEHDRVCQQLSHAVGAANAHPLGFTVLVGEDFNFLPRGETPLALSRHAPSGGRDLALAPAALLAPRLRDLLGRQTEIQHCLPSHYRSATSAFSRLGRFYTSTPPWQLVLLKARCPLAFCAKWLHDNRFSDHRMVQFTWSWAPQLPANQRPVPKFVVSLPTFAPYHESMCTAAHLGSLQVVDRWSVHKDVFREVAKVAMDGHLALHGHVGEGASLTLISIARAVWFAGLGPARVLMARSLIARTHLQIHDRSVSIRDPVSFASLVGLDRHSTFAQRIAAAEAGEPVGTKKVRSKSSYVCAIERMAMLWSLFDKRLVLSGIRCKQPDGSVSIATSPSGKVAALRDSWAPTFSAKLFDSELASRVLARYANPCDFSGVSPPCFEDFEAVLLKVRPFAPGSDCLPYSAWEAAGRSGAVTLHLVTHQVQ